MRREDLNIGDVVKLSGPSLRAWFAPSDLTAQGGPDQILVGSRETARSIPNVYDESNLMLYIGAIDHNDGFRKIRQMRLFYVGGRVGYVEYYDIDLLEKIAIDTGI